GGPHRRHAGGEAGPGRRGRRRRGDVADRPGRRGTARAGHTVHRGHRRLMAENFGLTWWRQRWIAALEALGQAYANRLPRGRTYARGGAVADLVVAAGQVTARVYGRRTTPYRVSMAVPVFTDPQWPADAHALARQLRHSAALLDGRMPEDIDETLDVVGL